jgi:tetratricopeptide (TPR) repeat protein
MKPRSRLLCLSAVAPLIVTAACSQARAGSDTSPASRSASSPGSPDGVVRGDPDARRELLDEPLEDYRAALLDLAFDAASAMPLKPHVKDRSSAQEAVVRAMLELGQRRHALECLARIENWRRGLAFAELAVDCVEHGHGAADVAPFLEAARTVADGGEEELGQSWRRDRILVTMARARVLLGQPEEAQALEVGLVESEAGKADVARAAVLDAAFCDEQIEAVEHLPKGGSLDVTRNALETVLRLYDRHYDGGERRARLEAVLDAGVRQVPRMVGIDVLLRASDAVLAHGNAPRALELVDRALALEQEARWTPEDHIRLVSIVAAARWRAGDREEARRQADSALELFEAEREDILDMRRAGALRPLAEAYQAMGDTHAALAVYRKAVEEGALNPNARPRANDLYATCVSMAVRRVEPDHALEERLTAIRAGLQDPW